LIPTPDPAGGTDALCGRTLGDFVVRERIGQGGFGAVYRAEQVALGRQAVVKVLHARQRGSEGGAQRFLREAKLASKLDHPYAAHIYAFGAEPDGLLWIAMELVRGTPLDQLLATQGRIPLSRFVPLLDKLCEVLSSAHEQGIVHRDIKPANVMVLARAGRLLPKLLDFGIAKLVDDSSPPAPFDASPSASIELLADSSASDNERETVDRSDDSRVTRAGAVLGSPPYMAPEQWANSTQLGPRTDQYALAVLTYEALTGRLPFSGRTLIATARAHAKQPVPPLGEDQPAALDAVLQRAMAKQVDGRFATTIEFATAFRAAAGLMAEPQSLPRLDDPIREATLADAPQPIAQAVAALDAAQNAHQAREAVSEIVAVTARWVGLLALASRSRVGAAGRTDSSVVVESLAILRRRTLGEREWIELAHGLTQPFAAAPDTHPLPELVELLRAGAGPFEPLLERAEAPRMAQATDAESRAFLERELPDLAALLRALGFLCDYALVVPRDTLAERWMGLRRGKRTASPRQAGLRDGEPALLDHDGAPVLALWPLVQCAQPTPGAPEELFLFEGQGRRGARLIARPAGYERTDDSVPTWLRTERLGIAEETADATAQRAPFLGLAAFTAQDAEIYVGREREVDAVLNRLRVQPLVAVVGPSGAGKSSFVHAGVVPSLPQGWSVASLRPGPRPMDGLKARLGRLGVTAADLGAGAESLRRALSAIAGVTLIVVDQFEECFTLCHDDEERRRFIATLVSVARSADDRVRVLLTLRDDFLMRAEQEPAVRERLGQGLQLIGTPSRDDLERMLVEPIRRVGYDFEDRALPSEMVREIADRPGALPLLSFTAAKMWELRDRHFKQLTRKVYSALGGVGGALAQHAEETLAALPADEQRLVREAFRHLVTADGTRAVLRREELIEAMGGGRAPGVVEKLVGARLISIADGDGGNRVEVTHEALLVAWPRLVLWRQEDAQGARMRDQLRAAARQWEDRGRPDGLLWRGDALAELTLWRARHGSGLLSADREFADASARLASRGRRRIRLSVAAIVLSLVAVTAAQIRSNRIAQASAQEARARVAELYEEQGRQALLDDDPERALLYLLESMRGGRDDGALRFLLARALDEVQPLERTWSPHSAPILHAEVSADGKRLLSASATERRIVLSQVDGDGARTFTTVSSPWTAAFTDGDRRVVSYEFDGTVEVFAVDDGRVLARAKAPGASTGNLTGGRPSFAKGRLLAPHGDTLNVFLAADARLERSLVCKAQILGATITPDAGAIAAVTADGRVHAWGADGRPRWEAPLLDGRPLAADVPIRALFSNDGDKLVVGAPSGAIVLHDARTGALLARFDGHASRVSALAFARGGALLISGTTAGELRTWDVPHRRPRSIMLGHRQEVRDLALDETRGLLLSASFDGTTRVWGLDDGDELALLRAHRGSVLGVISDPDRTLTYGADGTIRAWSASLPHRLRRVPLGDLTPIDLVIADRGDLVAVSDALELVRVRPAAQDQLERRALAPGSGRGWRARLSADGLHLAASAADSRAVSVFALEHDLPARRIDEGAGVVGFALSSDGRRLITTLEDGGASLWDLSDGSSRKLGARGPGAVAFDAPGLRVATGARDGVIRVWDVRDGVLLRELHGHGALIAAMVASREGDRLATSALDQTARLWDLRTGALITTLEHDAPAGDVALSSDGVLAATLAGSVGASSGSSVRIWDAHTGRLLASERATDSGDAGIQFAADGRALASASTASIKWWRIPRFEGDVATLSQLVGCAVPYELRDGRAVARPQTRCRP
jgi:serine/threonine protein kinase/WD40 repeat protein